MARSQLLLACLALSALAVANARAINEGRGLQQFLSQNFCPDGCADDGCIQDATRGGLRCQKCQAGLVVDLVTGNCACPAGKYASAADPPACTDCPKGSYCPGDDFYLPSNPNNPNPGELSPKAYPCPIGSNGLSMTTLGRRATSQRACVNIPGTYYYISADGNTIDQITCAVNTYGAGFKKQRACVPCPTGYTTNGVTGAISPTQCVVPAGYFLKGPGQVAPCPKGEYKEGVGTSANCTKCAFGVTTIQEASISVDNCTIVTPGYYARAITNGIVTQTTACPQKYYCGGGVPKAAFSPVTRTIQSGDPTIALCPYGMWTIDIAATAAQQCLTPPGHYTNSSGTYQCASGSYRADWKPYGEATECLSCGEGVKADTTDRVTSYDIDTLAPTQIQITTSSDDCYIMPGQGLYYTTLTRSWRAKNCIVNSYGVANKTYGLTPSACRDCPTNMVTALNGANTSYPTSSAYWVQSGNDKGFNDVRACVTQDGFGYNGRIAQACDKGFYNPKDTYSPCTACVYGLTTEGVGKGKTVADCGLAQGFGNYDGAYVPCPIGTYNNLTWTANTSKPCTSCATGLTTAAEGSQTSDACNLCVLGYGGPSCASQCGGVGSLATYGPAGRSTDTDPSCLQCSNQTTGYSFEWNMQNDLFQARAVSKPLASSALDCVAEYSQIQDGAWYIDMPATDPYSVVFSSVNTFADCVAKCQNDTTNPCEFATYDYVAQTCTVREGRSAVYVGAPLIAFKNLPSGDVGTNSWSVDKTKAHQVSTGSYTFYREEQALIVGNAERIVVGLASAVDLAALDASLQLCLDACDDDVLCTAITIEMTVEELDRPTTCTKIRGVTKVGKFKRTVTRADTGRMALPSLRDFP